MILLVELGSYWVSDVCADLTAVAGGSATIASDALMNPFDGALRYSKLP